MSIVNIISAIGNNNSIYPLLIRDCGIENLAKCVMTYRQNAPESKFVAVQATRERIIDEYGTSAVWLGGIPLMGVICDKLIKKTGLSPNVNLKLFKESSAQGVNFNIEKFKKLAPDAVKDLEKVKNNKAYFQKLQAGKFFATTAIPIAVMGFLLPKLNFAYTKKKIEQTKSKTSLVQEKTSNQINFKGLEKVVNLTDLQKMMILDGGLTVGRVQTGRNNDEKAELAFKMAGMCYLNYLAPKSIEKGLNKITKKFFGINTELDVKILTDSKFLEEVKNKSLKIPKANDEKTIIEFIDKNPNSIFVKQLKKQKLVSFLRNGIRDPREFVDKNKIIEIKESIEKFSKDALKSNSLEKFAKKAYRAKTFNIITNVLFSSFLLAIALPKAQFIFRKLFTGSRLEPGIKGYEKAA